MTLVQIELRPFRGSCAKCGGPSERRLEVHRWVLALCEPCLARVRDLIDDRARAAQGGRNRG